MADTVLKFAPSAPATKTRASGWVAMLRARARMILLVIVPLIALVAGLGFYLAGGRYVSTDNAYVGAQKVLITPDVSGKIDKIAVREGQ
ncbi:MAG TPA: HlyD family secretion protein, partial [Xanthobacteraceae bacterium]|nr:HlyD family secretion protein [Xanthobacteraceae bacterium]